MCDFGISETIAGVSAGIAASASSAAAATASAAATAGSAIAAGASAAGGAIAEGAVALGAALGVGGGGGGGAAAAGGTTALAIGNGAITDAALIASASGATSAGGLSFEAGMGLASLVLSAGGGGASAGVNAKQAKAQSQQINQQAKNDRRNAVDQANVEAQGNAQKNFELAVAGLAGRGSVQAANLSERSVRAIGRSVGFQTGTDRATVAKNQEIANAVATARLRGIDLTHASQKLQVGNPSTIAGIGAVNTFANSLNAGASAYRAFSNFRIPTDPNLAFV